MPQAMQPSHPRPRSMRRRALGVALIFLLVAGLSWLITTTTLPYALAKTSPEAALWLNPKNPVALEVTAARLRQRLLDTTRPEPKEAPGGNTENNNAKDKNAQGNNANSGRDDNAPAETPLKTAADPQADPQADRAAERRKLRAEIAAIARRLLQVDPLNATAFRLLGEVSGDPASVRSLMQAAVVRSRREAAALFWLLNDAIAQRRYAKASAYADTLMRTTPQLARYVASFFAGIMQEPEGRKIVERALKEPAAWRGVFFATLPRLAVSPGSVLRLMVNLKKSDHPVTTAEQAPFIARLVQTNRIRLAYNTWLQLLPTDALSNVKLINNAGFEEEPSGLPFDWQVSRGLNAVAEFTPAPQGSGRAYHLRFAVGRVTAPRLSQVLVLRPGRYRLGGRIRGEIRGKRGLVWRVRCLSGRKQVLGGSRALFGPGSDWQRFAIPFHVPEGADCMGQRIVLSHDSRSASEQFVSGAMWFDDIEVKAAPADGGAISDGQ